MKADVKNIDYSENIQLDNGCSIQLSREDRGDEERIAYIGYDSNNNIYCDGGFRGRDLSDCRKRAIEKATYQLDRA